MEIKPGAVISALRFQFLSPPSILSLRVEVQDSAIEP